MNTDAERAGWARRITDLLNKTIENGATAEEEKSAVQMAYQLTRQHALDMGEFKAKLAMVGSPPRYLITSDGFLLPFAAVRPDDPARSWDGSERRSRAAASERTQPDARECPDSPSGQHRMVASMRGPSRPDSRTASIAAPGSSDRAMASPADRSTGPASGSGLPRVADAGARHARRRTGSAVTARHLHARRSHREPVVSARRGMRAVWQSCRPRAGRRRGQHRA